jgi:hypothetical protein
METLGNKNQQKSAARFYCEICHYKTDRKCNFSDHLVSLKHLKNADLEKNGNKNQQNQQKNSDDIVLSCENCCKTFKSSSGLWKHTKNCNSENKNELIKLLIQQNANKILEKDEIISYLMKENLEFKNMMVEQQNTMLKIMENGTTQMTNSTNNSNNNNKTFNLQFFLNETCKDAMNITDFVDSIKLQLTDLEKVCDIGYTQGISDIITTNLKALDVTKRPLHCTDKKRETVYIKDENTWEKEDENKSKLRKVIKKVANKNSKLLSQFREKNPNYKNSDSHVSDKYDRMVIEAMGGVGDNDSEKENKIIHNISNCVTIDKIVE